MATRSYTAKIGADTSDFEEGIKKATTKLNDLNKSLISNQYEIKRTNQTINKYEKQQKSLEKQLKETTEKQTSQKAKLTELEKAMSTAENATEKEKEELEKLKKEIEETNKVADKQREAFAKVTEQLNQAQDKVANLKTEQAKLKSSIKDATQELDGQAKGLQTQLTSSGNAIQGLGEQTKTFSDHMSDAKVSGASLVKTLGTITGAVTALGSVIGVKSVQAAANVKAANAQFEQTFGDLQDDARDAMGEVAESSGIVETRLQGVATSVYAFAKASGMEATEALKLMEDALEVTADSAAYYDRSLEDTAESLKSFLKGNFENDAALGVSCTETTRNIAANKLYGESFKDLSEAQKQVTLLQMVKEANELSGAMGQAARESGSYENVLGNLSETWKQLLATIGEPILDEVIELVNELVDELNKLKDSGELETKVKEICEGAKNLVIQLKNLLEFCWKYKEVIVGVTAAMIAWKVSMSIGSIIASLTGAVKALTTAKKEEAIATEVANTAHKANTYVLVASAILRVVSAIATFVTANNNAKNNIEATKSTAEDYTKAMRDAKSAMDEEITTTEGSIATLKRKEERYDELRKKVNLTAAEKKELDEVAQELAKALNTTTEQLKSEDGTYKSLTQSVDEYIRKLREEVKLKNAKSVLEKAYQVVDVDVTQDKVDEALKKYKEYRQSLIDKIREEASKTSWAEEFKSITDEQILSGEYTLNYTIGISDEERNKLKQLEHTWGDLLFQRQQAEAQIVEYEGIVADVYDKANNKTDEQTSSFEELSEAIKDAEAKTKAVKQAEEDYSKTAEISIDTLTELKGKYPELEKSITDYINGQKTSKELLEEIQEIYDNDESVKKYQDTAAAAEQYAKELKEIEGKAKLLKTAQAEVNETGKLTASTVQDIIDKYPKLYNKVQEYIHGQRTAKQVVEDLTKAYDTDAKNFETAINAKGNMSINFYDALSTTNAKYVNDLKSKYGIDLKNYKTVEEAKTAVAAQAAAARRKVMIDEQLALAKNYINSGSDELARIGRSIKSSIADNKYKNTNIDNQAKEAGRKAGEEFTKTVNKALQTMKNGQKSTYDFVYDNTSTSKKSGSGGSKNGTKATTIAKNYANTAKEYYTKAEKYYKNAEKAAKTSSDKTVQSNAKNAKSYLAQAKKAYETSLSYAKKGNMAKAREYRDLAKKYSDLAINASNKVTTTVEKNAKNAADAATKAANTANNAVSKAQDIVSKSTSENAQELMDLAEQAAKAAEQAAQRAQKAWQQGNEKLAKEEEKKAKTEQGKAVKYSNSATILAKTNIQRQKNHDEYTHKIDEVDHNYNMGKITAAQQLEQYKKLYNQYKQYLSEAERWQAEETVRSMQLAQEQEKEEKNAATLQKRYELAEEAYNKLIDKRLEKIEAEKKAKEDAKNAAIDAIDAEIEARKRLNEDRNIQEELDFVNARLQYEQLDDLTRRELERKRQDLLDEQAETEWQRAKQDEKDRINAEYEQSTKNLDAAAEALQKAAQSMQEYFNNLKDGGQTYRDKTQINNVTNNKNMQTINLSGNNLSNKQIADEIMRLLYKK